MNTPPSPSAARIGALVPLTPPGWVEAGRHLLAGIELAVREVNDAGGIAGRPVELVVRDTAADPGKAAAAVDELAGLGVAALAGEYHSVAARAAAARAQALRVPFLCSSAVLDALTDQPADWVARLAPAQSHGWPVYADFLLRAGHSRIAVAAEPSAYWASGTRILRDYLAPHGGTITELDLTALTPSQVCDQLAGSPATAVLLLAGYPEPAVSLVRSVRRDQRLAGLLIGAPAGQPELPGWAAQLGHDGAAIPFLRYQPEHPTPLGARVEAALHERLAEPPSFVAFEGWDTIATLAELLRPTHPPHRPQTPGPPQTPHQDPTPRPDRAPRPEQMSLPDRAPHADQTLLSDGAPWPRVAVEGTRGLIQFSRTPGISVWQWAWAPVQVAERDPAEPSAFRVSCAS